MIIRSVNMLAKSESKYDFEGIYKQVSEIYEGLSDKPPAMHRGDYRMSRKNPPAGS